MKAEEDRAEQIGSLRQLLKLHFSSPWLWGITSTALE